MTQTRQEQLAQKLAALKKKMDDERNLTENNAFLARILDIDAQELDWQGSDLIRKLWQSNVYPKDIILCVPFLTDADTKVAMHQVIEVLALPTDQDVAISICLPREPYWTNWFVFKGVKFAKVLQRVFYYGVWFIIKVGDNIFLVESNEDELRASRVR